MISFRDTLADMVNNVGGGLGAVIMGYDGIAIEEYTVEQTVCDMPLIAVEYATLLKEVRRTVSVLKTGEMEEMTVITTMINVIVRLITDEFFLILVMDTNGNHGKGRFLLRRAVPLLREELQ